MQRVRATAPNKGDNAVKRAIAGAGAVLVLASACSGSSHSGSTPAPSGSGTSSSGSTTSATGVTSTSIKIGLIATQTGGLASSWGPGVSKAVQGAFDQVNSSGGINGRKLQLVTVDDATNPAQGLTAAKSLVSQGVFAILTGSGTSPIQSATYLHQHSVPVIGLCADGPEWSDPVNSTNMFSWNGCNGKLPATTTLTPFFKSRGVTKLAVVAYGGIPGSVNAANAYAAGLKAGGIPTVYKGFSAQPGQASFSVQALGIKNAGADGVVTAMDAAGDLAVSSALAAVGYKPRVQFNLGAGYEPTTLSDATTNRAGQDNFFSPFFRPLEETSNSAVQATTAALQSAGISGFPSSGTMVGWLDAQMLIAGLKQVGAASLTQQSFIDTMHNLSGFDANGLLASKINEKDDWGQGLNPQDPNYCIFLVQLKGKKFVPQNNGEPFCGAIVPGVLANPKGLAPDPK